MVSLISASFALAALGDTGDTIFPFCPSRPPGCLRLPLSSVPPGSGSSSVGEDSVQLPPTSAPCFNRHTVYNSL